MSESMERGIKQPIVRDEHTMKIAVINGTEKHGITFRLK